MEPNEETSQNPEASVPQGRDRATVRRIMQSVKSEGGRADKELGRILWRRGFRYRRKNRLVGKPDLVFSSARVVVFVDGDFWHGRFLSERIARGDFKRNAEYWIKKLNRTIERDKRNTVVLEEAGWRVVRVWESEILKDPGGVADYVESQIRKGRTGMN